MANLHLQLDGSGAREAHENFADDSLVSIADRGATHGGGVPNTEKSERPLSVDSYDNDLAWITERLTDRAGGSLGLVCRFINTEADCSIIAYSRAPTTRDVAVSLRVARTLCHRFHEKALDATVGQVVQQALEPVADEPDYELMFLTFHPSESVTLAAAVLRQSEQGPFDAFSTAMAQMLYPVLARYIQLWWLHRKERNRASAFRTGLDVSDIGVLLLDRRLEIAYENSYAHGILLRRKGIFLSGRQISAELPGDAMALQGALQHARQFNLHCSGDKQRRQRAPLLALQRTGNQRALIVSIVGLASPAIDAQDPCLIVYILDPDRDFQALLRPVCSIYNLTNAESRLAYWLTCGLPICEAADKMKIQIATARSYLKQIFCKTHTNRQADLVRLFFSAQRVNATVDLMSCWTNH